MNFKEAFSRIEKDERTLSPILRQRQLIEEFKQQLMDPSQKDETLLKVKSRLIDTGALDVLSEALDYLPECELVIRKEAGEIKEIGVIWGMHETWNEVGLELPRNSDAMRVYSGLFKVEGGNYAYIVPVGQGFDISFDSKELQEPCRVAVAIADAVWKAGGKTPNTQK